MQHFYDGQIRKYVTQVIRLLSNFKVKDIDNEYKDVPCVYGDLSRQVGSILKDNSELKIIGVPKISVYITNLEVDRSRTSDSTFISRRNVTLREYDQETDSYTSAKGKSYTVDRVMPSPYTLSLNADIWTSNTDQKLQIIEQILMLFNPSLEIQTSDNWLDWTSLSVLNLDQLTFSSRSIGTSTETEIDIATLGFTTPIYISLPTKVKKLGIIHTIITSIFNEQAGNVDLNLTMPELLAYSENRYRSTSTHKPVTDKNGNVIHEYGPKVGEKPDVDSVVATTVNNYGLFVIDNTAKLIYKEHIGTVTWNEFFLKYPDKYVSGITELHLYLQDLNYDIVGTVSINPVDNYCLNIAFDIDTLPTDTIISGNTKIHYIIDPTKTNPTNLKFVGLRVLLLESAIGADNNVDGADAWKNTNGTDFVADANDIIEWDGANWNIVFDASEHDNSIIYTTNLNTNIQYKFQNNNWILSYFGEYPHGTWSVQF